MNLRNKVIAGLILGGTAVLMVPGAGAQPGQEEIIFSGPHFCTKENVSGETWVKMDVETTDNGNGTTTVTTKQRAHGSQLYGTISMDKYVLNESSERVETFMIVGSTGTLEVDTHFIHNSEAQAFAEIPGMDDLKQKTEYTLVRDPLGNPQLIMTGQESDCY
jgi:hypothetical protein